MDINDFLGIGIVGVLLSAVIEVIQARLGSSSLKTKFITIGLSILVGGAYFLIRETVWWATILGVLASASTVYAILLKDLLSNHD